jgi:transcriptional regulator with GAF, ATPase, and Fis domain
MSLANLRARHLAEERAEVLAALERSGWGLHGAARELGIGVSTLQAMIGRLGLAEEYRARARPPGRPRRAT